MKPLRHIPKVEENGYWNIFKKLVLIYPDNVQNMNPKTLGFGMAFMHELNHTKLGYHGAYAADYKVIGRVNTYREQLNKMGLNYSRRFGHDVKEINGYKVFPFWDDNEDGRSVDPFLIYQMPTSRSAKFIKVKIEKRDD